MADETSTELLGRVPIFQGLNHYQLAMITRNGRHISFDEGAVIMQAGETGKGAHLILSGFVAPGTGYESMFATEVLGYGTLLGEIAMLVENVFTVTIFARWRVHALSIPRDTLYALMEHDPAIAHHFAGKLVARLQRLAGDLRGADAHFEKIERSLDKTIAMVS